MKFSYTNGEVGPLDDAISPEKGFLHPDDSAILDYLMALSSDADAALVENRTAADPAFARRALALLVVWSLRLHAEEKARASKLTRLVDEALKTSAGSGRERQAKRSFVRRVRRHPVGSAIFATAAALVLAWAGRACFHVELPESLADLEYRDPMPPNAETMRVVTGAGETRQFRFPSGTTVTILPNSSFTTAVMFARLVEPKFGGVGTFTGDVVLEVPPWPNGRWRPNEMYTDAGMAWFLPGRYTLHYSRHPRPTMVVYTQHGTATLRQYAERATHGHYGGVELTDGMTGSMTSPRPPFVRTGPHAQ